MSKSIKQSKYCNCQTSSNKKILKQDVNHSFCEKCGCILLKGSNGTIYYTMKAKQKRLPFEFNPISVIKSMKRMTEEKYPFMNEEFNVDKSDKINKDKSIKSINLYLKFRKMILLKLQKLMKTFDYCDLIFYQCLFFLDTYLSHDMTDDMTEKTILYNLVGYFLCALKLKETDIYEPSLDSFFDLSKGIYLSPDKIAYYEVLCLKNIKYNIFSYSAYDWITELLAIGVIFNCEVNSTNEVVLIKGHRHSLVNTINKYSIKLLLNLTAKSILFKYSPMYVALSLIQIAREKYIEQSLIKPKLFSNLINLFGVNPNDYKKCYDEIKMEINEDNNGNQKENINQNEIDNEAEELETINKKADRNESTKKVHKKNKNIYVPNKVKSSNVLVHVKDNLIKNTENSNSKDNEDKNSEEFKEKDNSKEDKAIELTLNEIGVNKKYKLKTEKDNIKGTEKRHNKHLSIDCTNTGFKNSLKSHDNLPHIAFNLKEKNLITNTIEEDKLGISQTKDFYHNNKRNKSITKELISLKTITNKPLPISLKTMNNSNIASSREKDLTKSNKKKKSKFAINSSINLDKINNNNNNDIILKKNSLLTSNKLPRLSNFEDLMKDRIETNIIELNKENNNKSKNKISYKLKNNNNLEINVTLPDKDVRKTQSNKKITKKILKVF